MFLLRVRSVSRTVHRSLNESSRDLNFPLTGLADSFKCLLRFPANKLCPALVAEDHTQRYDSQIPYNYFSLDLVFLISLSREIGFSTVVNSDDVVRDELVQMRAKLN